MKLVPRGLVYQHVYVAVAGSQLFYQIAVDDARRARNKKVQLRDPSVARSADTSCGGQLLC